MNTEYDISSGLTSNDFTNALKTKLEGISASANNYAFLVSAEDTAGTGTVSNGNTLSFTDSGSASVTRNPEMLLTFMLQIQHTQVRDFTITALSGFPGGSTQFLRADGSACKHQIIQLYHPFKMVD